MSDQTAIPGVRTTIASQFHLGVDIGGTFTDLSLIEEGGERIHTHKVASTPAAPSRAVTQGVSELMQKIGKSPAAIASFVHGTTIALNAILERRGAPIALFVTRGNRDILELGRLHKPDLFNLRAALPEPLLRRRDVYEVGGRIATDGTELEDVEVEEIDRLVAGLGEDIRGVAVCMLNAHANDRLEREIAAVIEVRRPDIHVSRSCEIWPEIREYERATVALLNAYVQPLMSRYVDDLIKDATEIGIKTPLYITRSNGGLMSASTARNSPVNTLLSGPASGVVGAAYVAGLSGVTDALTLDIGGTSADVSIIRGGKPVHSTEASVGDFPVIMPCVDVFSVGAGGGSIAWFDELGLLKLGPRSAGADPGPACYGKGGAEPTTTDAYVVCGYIDPDNFVGGTMPLSRELAGSAVGTVAERLGVSIEHAAESILKIATSTMASAILPMTTKRGIEPRDFTLIPFGGAGPTHACLLAEEIFVPRILLPPTPGTMCALGAVIADTTADYIRSFRHALETADNKEIRKAFVTLEQEARAWMKAERPGLRDVEIWRAADLRYRGQAFNLEVDLPSDIPTEALSADTIAAYFHETYEAIYHNSDPGAPVDLVNLRVRVVGRSNRPPQVQLPQAAPGELPIPRAGRPIFYGGRKQNADVFDRATLKAGHVIAGPAIIEQFDTTTIVAPGFVAINDENGNIILSKEGR